MKSIVKKIELENSRSQGICIFTRAKVGTHMGILLEEGKDNSIIIGITHSKSLTQNVNTYKCEFSAIANLRSEELGIDREVLDKIDKSESRAVLTIVNNNTILNKNQKILNKIRYSTSLVNSEEQEKLKEKILLKNKISKLSNDYNSKDTHILYQTRTKVEAISLSDKDRLVELVGIEIYENHFKPLDILSENLGDKGLSIANILNDKTDKDGIEGLINIINKMSW